MWTAANPFRRSEGLDGALHFQIIVFEAITVEKGIDSTEPALEVPRLGVLCDEVQVNV